MRVLSDIADIVDCEHKTAPSCNIEDAYAFSVGTPSLRGDRIDLNEARPVNESTYREWSKRKILAAGDIILAREAPAGGVGYVTGSVPLCLGQRTVLVHAHRDEVEPRFLAYLLKSQEIQEWIRTRSSIGSTVGHLNVSDIKEIPISNLPKIGDQQTILEAITPIDDLIDLNTSLRNELLAGASLIYSYWFQQFEFPSSNSSTYRSSGGSFEFNNLLHREIPSGWAVGNLAVNRISKLIGPGISLFEGTKTYLATADVVGDAINSEASLITYSNRESRADMEPTLNSIWFAKMKATKKSLFFGNSSKDLIEKIILSTGFQGIQCNEDSFEYLINIIVSDDFEKRKDLLAIGATQEAINLEAMRFIPILEPPVNVLKEFHNVTKDYYSRIIELDKTNLELRKLREWLVPRVLAGLIKVS
jgi:type I restriction enzyme S subunit